MGEPLTGNVLDNARVPTGQAATVTGFSVGTSNDVIAPGSGPITLNDPDTGLPMGTLDMKGDGTYTFTPEPGYVGPAPAISVFSRTTDGQTIQSGLTIDVVPRESQATAYMYACGE